MNQIEVCNGDLTLTFDGTNLVLRRDDTILLETQKARGLLTFRTALQLLDQRDWTTWDKRSPNFYEVLRWIYRNDDKGWHITYRPSTTTYDAIILQCVQFGEAGDGLLLDGAQGLVSMSERAYNIGHVFELDRATVAAIAQLVS